MTPAEFRALRKSMALTQADLAARMGVTNDTISAIEVGRKGDPIPALYDLAMRWLGGINRHPTPWWQSDARPCGLARRPHKFAASKNYRTACPTTRLTADTPTCNVGFPQDLRTRTERPKND